MISHATALLAGDKRTFAVRGDLRDPEGILTATRDLELFAGRELEEPGLFRRR